MQKSRGMIILPDPLAEGRRFGGLISQMQKEIQNTETLIFDEDGRFLSQLRAALQHMRGLCARVGIMAEGRLAGAAVSVAAQLPVDEIMLFDSRIFAPRSRETRAERQMGRINGFARRNLSLVVCDTALVDCGEGETRRLLRCMVNCSICILHSGSESMDNLWQKDKFCPQGPGGIFKLPGL